MAKSHRPRCDRPRHLRRLRVLGTKLQGIEAPAVGSTLDIEHNSELRDPLFTFGFNALKVVDNPQLKTLLSEPVFHKELSFVTITGNAALTDISAGYDARGRRRHDHR